MFDFHNKVVVITGASSGLGLQMVEAFAEQGADIAIISRRKEKLNEIAEQMKQKEITCLPVPCDVTVYSQINEAASYIEEYFGRIDVLINCAANGVAGGILDTSKNDWDKTILGTLSSIFYTTQVFAKTMVKNRYGRIINISSMHGMVGSSVNPMVAYQTAKGGVINFTRAVAAELAEYNVTCNAICPGYFPTEKTFEKHNETENVSMNNNQKLKSFIRHINVAIPMKRVGNYGEMNAGAIFLASEEASYVTGAVLAIDGGYTAI